MSTGGFISVKIWGYSPVKCLIYCWISSLGGGDLLDPQNEKGKWWPKDRGPRQSPVGKSTTKELLLCLSGTSPHTT